MDRNDLVEQVRAASRPVHLATKAELVTYYQAQQKEGHIKSWRQAIVSKLHDITGMKEKNLQRRFDPSRLHNLEKRNAAQYRQLGQQLPPVGYAPPMNGYKVTFGGWILIAGEYCEYRTFTRYITGDEAANLAGNMDFSPIFDVYFETEGVAEELCGKYNETTFSVKAA